MLSKILIDPSPEGGLLTRDGAPVWPAQNPEDVAAVRRAAILHGLDVEEVRGARGALPPLSDEEVVSLGDDRVAEIGRLYAHLTGRRFRRALDPEDVPGDRLAVLVTLADDLHSDLLMDLYPPPEGVPAPGILCGANLDDLRRQALVRAAATLPAGPPETPWLHLYQKRHITPPELSSNTGLREMLGAGAGLLTVRTHSNGLDAWLGPSTVLCPLDGVTPGAGLLQRPRCHITGHCHKLKMPVDEARDAGALLAPEELSARVLVLESCFGLLQPDATLDPAWTFAPRLVASPRIGAFLTSWNVHFGGEGELAELADDLGSGTPLGDALSRFLNAPERRHRIRLCLFGDPRLRLPPSSSSVLSAAKPVAEKRPPREGRRVAGELDLRRRMILEELDNMDDETRALADPVLEALAKPGGTTDAELRELMLQFLLSWAYWPSPAQSIKVAEGSCHLCGRRTDLLLTRFPGAGDRRINLCARCGRTQDMPASADVCLWQTDPRRLALTGSLPSSDWCAGVIVESAGERFHYRWPAAEDGSPAETCDISSARPIGPIWIKAFFLHKDDVSFLSLYMRDEAPLADRRCRFL
jgi:hypothetical protein